MGRPGARGLLLLAAFLGLCGTRGGLGGTRPNFPSSPGAGRVRRCWAERVGGRREWGSGRSEQGVQAELEQAGPAALRPPGALRPHVPELGRGKDETRPCSQACPRPATSNSQPPPVSYLFPVISEILSFKVGHLTSRMADSCGQPGCIIFVWVWSCLVSCDLQCIGGSSVHLGYSLTPWFLVPAP